MPCVLLSQHSVDGRCGQTTSARRLVALGAMSGSESVVVLI